ncbi:MAG: hypothetical protein CVU34_08490 [Betaproteobacteria bacterium HGW-Betaproteobacteria-7]|jgi:hypothetical protein|nr:MAG: hypothetical protein CVU34_08490 [Betaproteobacteria bacterium HGW-Betaproteobacteria-7]
MDDKVLLAPPGAGLPPLERWISRTGLGALRNTLNRRQIEGWLRSETRKVLAIAGELSAEQMKRKVLIPRPTGLEDSSRNWSAAMVLQHLVIVDTGIGELIAALAQNQTFGREVRIAEVKPAPDAGREQLELLENALRTYIDRMSAVANLRTAGRHAHPWFGPLDGHGWHTLTALHTMIHRRQLCAVTRVCSKHPAFEM